MKNIAFIICFIARGLTFFFFTLYQSPSNKMDLTYSNDVAKKIDESRYQQQFFENKRGLYNHSVNPFARRHMKNAPVQYREHHPEDSNRVEEVVMSTECCSRPGQTVVIGRKSEDAPIENGTFFWKELRSMPHPNRRCSTTKRIGFDLTENA